MVTLKQPSLDTRDPRTAPNKWVATTARDLLAASQIIKDIPPWEEVFVSHPNRFTLVVWEDHGQARQVEILDGEIIPSNE